MNQLNDIQVIGTTIYTASTRTSGELRTKHPRLSDTFNAIDQDFVLVHDAIVHTLHGYGEEIPTPWSLVRKDSIVLALLMEARAGVEVSIVRQNLIVDRVPLQARVEAWPFVIDGTLYLPPNTDLLQHIHDPHRQFMPMTDSHITYQASPPFNLDAMFLLVNRRAVEIVLDTSLIGSARREDPDIAPNTTRTDDISGAEAAQLLSATSVFKGIPLGELESLCTEQVRGRRISRKLVTAGATIFSEGDLGDSMYVVEKGALEVLLTPQGTTATLGAGDIFGEMATLGVGKRTATVRSLQPSSIIAIQEDAVQLLIQKYPMASSRLLSLVLARSGGLSSL